MRRFGILVGAWLWATAAFAQAPAQPPPLEAFGLLPALEQVEISPDGAHIAFTTTKDDERVLVVSDSAARTLVTSLKLGRIKVRRLEWTDERHLLITTSNTALVSELAETKDEWNTVQILDITNGKQTPLLANLAATGNVVFNHPILRKIDGKTYAFLQAFHDDSDRVLALYRVDLDSGAPVLVKAGHIDTEAWFVDRDGQPAAEARYVPKTGKWSLMINRTRGGWINSRTIDAPIDEPDIVGYGRDGQTVLVRVLEDHKTVLHAVSLADGSWGPAEPDDYDELIFDPLSGALLGGADLRGDERVMDFFEPALAAIWKAIETAYPDERVRLESWTRDHRKVVVLVDGPRDGYAYALDDLDAKRGDWLGAVYPMLLQEQIAQPKSLSYKAADGLEIPAYLTLPVGAGSKNLPLIVMPHGGPAARDTLGFDWLREALASRGYAVLQPNFRGSTGYDAGFLEAGYGQLGRKMQTDLSDGVRYLVAQGVVDPKRVCIFGWSYGGYAALAGATIDPGVYRCAADMAGFADVQIMMQQAQAMTNGRDNDVLRFWERYMGAKSYADPVLAQISPVKQAAKVAIPVLIVHGKDDTVVDYQQSVAMANALKRAGKPYTFVTLDGEDHYGSRSETRLKLLQAVMDFLIKNNPP